MAKPARAEVDHVPGGGRTSVAGWPGGILSRDGTRQDKEETDPTQPVDVDLSGRKFHYGYNNNYDTEFFFI